LGPGLCFAPFVGFVYHHKNSEIQFGSHNLSTAQGDIMQSACDLTGKKALITGASRGIGRAVAEMLADHGAQVVAHYGTDEEAATHVLNGLTGEGHAILSADLGDATAAGNLAGQAAKLLGGLDVVVNNAGIFVTHDIAELDQANWQQFWDRTIAVNLNGPAHVLHGAIPHLEKAGGGHIINVTSRGAFRGEPEAPAYGASKAGLNSLSQSLAVALAPRNIKVGAVAPGWVLTDMTRDFLAGPGGKSIRAQSPMGRTATADEIAHVVLMVVSGRADALSGGIIDINCASYLR
jgi:3-oxoacyl-[acyl-carrier protein] reductase